MVKGSGGGNLRVNKGARSNGCAAVIAKCFDLYILVVGFGRNRVMGCAKLSAAALTDG